MPVAGLSWVPITPVRAQGLGALGRRRRGDARRGSTAGVERERRLAPHRVRSRRAASPTIAAALDALAAAHATPATTVFVLHSPPRDTRCDMIGARHARRLARDPRFIERAPAAAGTLRPDIHESPRVSSSYRDTMTGAPESPVNPGAVRWAPSGCAACVVSTRRDRPRRCCATPCTPDRRSGRRARTFCRPGRNRCRAGSGPRLSGASGRAPGRAAGAVGAGDACVGPCYA